MKAKRRPSPVRDGDDRRRRSTPARAQRAAPPTQTRHSAGAARRREQRPLRSAPADQSDTRDPPAGPPGPRTPARPRPGPRRERRRRPRLSAHRCASDCSSSWRRSSCNPRALAARVPFVVLVIGALGLGTWRHAVVVDRCRRTLLPAGQCTRDESGVAATEGGTRARRARGPGRTGAGRGRPQSGHDPVARHRAPGAGPGGKLDRGGHTQTRRRRSAAAAEHRAARRSRRRRDRAAARPRPCGRPREVADRVPPGGVRRRRCSAGHATAAAPIPDTPHGVPGQRPALGPVNRRAARAPGRAAAPLPAASGVRCRRRLRPSPAVPLPTAGSAAGLPAAAGVPAAPPRPRRCRPAPSSSRPDTVPPLCPGSDDPGDPRRTLRRAPAGRRRSRDVRAPKRARRPARPGQPGTNIRARGTRRVRGAPAGRRPKPVCAVRRSCSATGPAMSSSSCC